MYAIIVHNDRSRYENWHLLVLLHRIGLIRQGKANQAQLEDLLDKIYS
jgi:hypothetical protein